MLICSLLYSNGRGKFFTNMYGKESNVLSDGYSKGWYYVQTERNPWIGYKIQFPTRVVRKSVKE